MPTSDDRSKYGQNANLTDHHRVLKARLRELDSHFALTSAERVERIQLKQLLRERQS